MRDLSGLFDPDRVAVIGASDRDGSVGRALMANLSSFDGDVLPVNPNRDSVDGRPCYPDIASVPEPASVDLAVVAVPASEVTDVVRQIGEVGIANVVVITAGFSETGDRGTERERDLIDVATAYDLNLVGPNCVGVISTETGLNATFLRSTVESGSISLMSQSGAFISAVLSWAAREGIGFEDVVSLGNEAVLDETDFLAEWGTDPDTDVILAYLEDVEDGRAFVETARKVTRETPVVVLKSGRTAAGAEAAASHTGSIAGSEQAYRAGIDQAGGLSATTVEDVFDLGEALAGQPLPVRDDVAVVTNGGGPGVLATDAIGESRLTVAEFGEDVRRQLEGVLPETTAVGNPLDVLGDADLERFRTSLDAVLGNDGVGGAIVISVPTPMFEFDELADVIVELQRSHGKPVVTCLMGGEAADRAADTLAASGIPTYFDPARAVPSLEALADYRDVRNREYGSPTTFDVDRERAREILAGGDIDGASGASGASGVSGADGAGDAGGTGDTGADGSAGNGTTDGHDGGENGDATAEEDGTAYLGVEAMDLLDAYGIPTPAGDLATSEADAESIAASIGGPVVMKIVSPDVVHKSDVGGVEVGVPIDRVRDTYRTIRERTTGQYPDATVLGVRIEELVDPEESTETIVGVNRDPQFGHVVMFGLGGIFVQIFEDTAFRVAPVTEREAREMTAEIQAAPMLRGARGRTPADVEAVVDSIQRVSQLVGDFPEIRELDINPLVVSPDGVAAVDLRLTADRDALPLDLTGS